MSGDSYAGPVEAVDTPVPLLDVDLLDRNIDRLQAYCDSNTIALWPHTKTHKSPEIARRQLVAGARGLTASKVREADAMLASGSERVLIAYPIFGRAKCDLVAEMAGRIDVSVALDSVETATPLAEAARRRGTSIGILLELDVGLHRVGTQSVSELADLAERVATLQGVEIHGIACYPGHLRSEEELEDGIAQVNSLLSDAVAALTSRGIRADRVSAGSSPTAFLTHLIPAVNESRAGTCVLGDLSDPAPDGYALTVLATVVSTRVAGRAVIDAGSKTLSSDRALAPEFSPYNGVLLDDGSPIVELFEEHGIIDTSNREVPLKVGDLVRVVPNHCCAVMNLHDEICVVSDDVVVDTWQITGRGMSQ